MKDDGIPPMLTLEEVTGITKLSKTTVYKRMNEHQFPPNFTLGSGDNAPARWLKSDIVTWINEMAKKRLDKLPKPIRIKFETSEEQEDKEE